MHAEPAAWKSISSLSSPEHAASEVVCHLAARCSLFASLSQLVGELLPIPTSPSPGPLEAVPLVERLVTGLTARSLALAPRTHPALQLLPQLLSVPLLWSR